MSAFETHLMYTQALYVAEQSARISVETRAGVRKQLKQQEQVSREKRIREIAAQALETGSAGGKLEDESQVRVSLMISSTMHYNICT